VSAISIDIYALNLVITCFTFVYFFDFVSVYFWRSDIMFTSITGIGKKFVASLCN
jgi:hypothetical protein